MSHSDEAEALAALLGQGGMPMPSMMPQPQPPSAAAIADDDDDIDDEDLDESLTERLLGLTEMFPESVRNVTCATVSMSWQGSKWLYGIGCSGMWVVASSAAILALPVMFETERAQMEEQQIQQQRQILLGPNAAVSGAGGGLMPGNMPQVAPPSAQAR